MNTPANIDGDRRFNESGIEIKALYTEVEVAASKVNGADADDIGMPGEYPFTRGIHREMYRKRP